MIDASHETLSPVTNLYMFIYGLIAYIILHCLSMLSSLKKALLILLYLCTYLDINNQPYLEMLVINYYWKFKDKL